jgi:ATP-dependent helicase/nuclease subunit B
VAPAVQSHETIRGGASVLKNQAQCPFKAFAEIRMNAKKINRPQLLLDAVERGKIVHAVLEEFWKRCGTQQQLLAWLPNMLDKVLQEVVASILTRWQHNFPITLTKNYIELEQQRLSSLMQRWLTYELQRAPFTVTQVEQKVKVNIGTLQLNVCVDRLDTLEDGSIVIIDYKTGNVEARDWFKENLIEPQMPLYAVSVRQKIAGVVYANVVPQKDNLKFTGALSQAGIMPDVKVYTEWDELLNDWQQKLLKSAADFTQGMAQVAPYDDLVCKRCNLQGLCRIYDC